MRRKYMKDKLMMIAANLEQVVDELGMLAQEFPDEDPCMSDSQLSGMPPVKFVPPEDR